MSAIDTQDYDLAAWLMARGASVTFVAHDRTVAWSLEFQLAKYVQGTRPVGPDRREHRGQASAGA